MSSYQIPRPISTMPIANHPTTPAEMIVSRVILESDGLESDFDSESGDFITRSEILLPNQIDAEPEAKFMPHRF